MSERIPNSPVPRMLRTTSGVLFSRIGLILATFASTYLASVAFGHVVFRGGVNPATVALWLLFCVLFLWVAQGFWTATIGLLQMLRHSPTSVFKVKHEPLPRLDPEAMPRTAVLMPVYNEDSVRFFAGLEAMIRSVHATGYGTAFDYYVLSDTTDPTVWLEEETQFAALLDQLADENLARRKGRTDGGPFANVYYRRRHKNVARKSGNIEDWCERFGRGYTYMLTLDADSVMDGNTIVEMVHRSTAEPDIGILQVPPQPVNRNSLFARCQQYAASVYGEVFNVGFGAWTHLDGNYYGHNALIRVQPFIDHCGLPLLPGKPPLGGEILSHDFVEAALIRKAGYKVQIAYDLDGSYEECPTTLVDYAIRDQRWCQGNLQHIRLVFTRGYRLMSRLHLGMGVMSYLASPLWLAFMLLGLVAVIVGGSGAAETAWTSGTITPWMIGVFLFVVVMLMLLIPKFYAVCLVLQRPDVMRAHGGELQAVVGAIIEVAVSVLIAPLMMVYHTTFVINTLIGRSVKWNAQQRDESAVGWGDAARNHWKQTAGGVVVGVLIAWLAPSLFLWALPVLLGLVVSIPVSVLLSSVTVGAWLRDRRLLMIPEEHEKPKVLRLHQAALSRTQAVADAVDDQHPMDRVVKDPAFCRFHLANLAANTEPFESPVNVAAAVESAQEQGLPSLGRPEQLAVLSNPHALRRLHHAAWA
ncbi:MAG: glucans biosynthesis glucosyltransferase MdoH [Planctomycetota bacterium]